MSFVCPSTYAFKGASKTQFIFITTICSESVVELERFVQDLKDNFRLGIQKYRVQKLIFDLGLKSSFLTQGSNVRGSKVHIAFGVQKFKVQMSRVQLSGVQKFIQHLGFKSPGFKCPGFNCLGFKSSFSIWGSKVQGSKVCGSKVQGSIVLGSKVHLYLRVQTSGVQKSGVQKFIYTLEFKNSWFKRLGSKVKVQLSGVQMFLSHIKNHFYDKLLLGD